MSTTTTQVPLSLKQYFDQRHEAGEEATKQAIIRCFRRAVDFKNCSGCVGYELHLQSYTSLFRTYVEKIYAYLLANDSAWWDEIEEVVMEMVQALMAEELIIARQRKFALLVA